MSVGARHLLSLAVGPQYSALCLASLLYSPVSSPLQACRLFVTHEAGTLVGVCSLMLLFMLCTAATLMLKHVSLYQALLLSYSHKTQRQHLMHIETCIARPIAVSLTGFALRTGLQWAGSCAEPAAGSFPASCPRLRPSPGTHRCTHRHRQRP